MLPLWTLHTALCIINVFNLYPELLPKIPIKVMRQKVNWFLLHPTTEFLHVKPGKGAAFVRTKLRNYVTGNTVEKTFRAGSTVGNSPQTHIYNLTSIQPLVFFFFFLGIPLCVHVTRSTCFFFWKKYNSTYFLLTVVNKNRAFFLFSIFFFYKYMCYIFGLPWVSFASPAHHPCMMFIVSPQCYPDMQQLIVASVS